MKKYLAKIERNQLLMISFILVCTIIILFVAGAFAEELGRSLSM